MSTSRTRAIVRAIVFSATLALPACTKNAAAAPPEGEVRLPGAGAPLKLALVTGVQGLGDKSLNDSAYAGMLRAKVKLGAEVQVLQSKSAADYQPNLTVLAAQDFDEIFAVGPAMTRDVATLAKNYPRRHFAIVDSLVDQVNVTSLRFRGQDGSFLAGALAAMVSKTKRVAFLGGVDLPSSRTLEAGFAAGAREADPKVTVANKYVGSFEDAASCKALAGELFDGGADIVLVAAGKASLGAIDQVRGRSNAYVIGVDTDQDALAPGKVLTSVIKRVDVAVFKTALQAQAQKLPAGPVELGLKDGGVGLSELRYTRRVVGAAHLARLAALRRAIVEGSIVPPTTREQLAAFKPIAL